ncbi:MAG: hypothetical protein J0L53_11575 [Spirochaetes bacterium]|nr:hypothetical protein [Spirochaetota bacterium]
MPINTRLRTALFVSICGFFALTVALVVVQPTKPALVMQPGVNSPIIGLEMALSPYEVWNVIGDPQTTTGQKIRAGFTLGTWIDFGYILAYSLCYLFLTWLLVSRHGVSWVWTLVTAVLVLGTAGADVLENLAIFKILNTGTESLVDLHIDQLIVFTRLKWLLLGVQGLPAVMLFRKEGRRGPAFLLTVAFAFGALGIMKQYAPEVMTLFLAFFWVYLFVKLLPLKNRWWA